MNVRLVGYEFRKNFLNRTVVLLLLVLLLVNAWKIHDVFLNNSILSPNRTVSFALVYPEFYEEYAGTITVEKITQLLEIYRPIAARAEAQTASREYNPDSYTYNDYYDAEFLERCFVWEMQYDYLYQNDAWEITQTALDNMEFYSKIGNTYEYEKNRFIVKLFQNRKLTIFSYTEGHYYYLFYDFSVILILFFCSFAMSGVFVVEKETEMNLLLTTSRKGGMATTAAKLTASALFVLLVCGIFLTEDYLVFSFCFGLLPANDLPLYTLAAFRNTPLRMSLGQFSLLAAVLKTLGILGCCLWFLFFSSVSRRVLPPFFAGIAFCVGLIFLQGRSLTKLPLKWANPCELVIGRDLFLQTRFVNLFGHPVLLYQAVIPGILIGMVLLSLFLLWNHRIRRKGGRKR